MAYTFKHGDRPVEGYTIQRAVGRGGFGEVYYAISDGGREVAVKYLRDNPQVELRGVSNCINLKSPHLVSIFDVKKTVDGEYSIVMEYCSGPSLRDLLIAEPNGFAAEKAAFFVREIAKGLAYLHDRGIVHRDLKPGNIFYDDGYVKIGDYGLSKFISVSRHSGQTASVGTVHYMAPEIGSGNYSRGVDIYALGVILYEMLLGKVPFEGSTMAEVLMKHLTAQPALDELPQPFGRVIRRALEKDPKDRYQTVDEMVNDILEVEQVRDSLAGFRPDSLTQAVRRARGDVLESPVPSPNPAPGFARGPRRPPYEALPPGPLPYKTAERFARIGRKMDAKMHKAAIRSGAAQTVPPAFLAGGSYNPEHRRRWVLLTGILSLGLAVGLGVLVGNTRTEEHGASAGMLVVALSGAVLLSRWAVGWFGVTYGPIWTQRMVRLCCSAPVLAIGSAPLFDSSSPKEGVAIWLGLIAVSMFAKWEKAFERGAIGEMSFSSAIGTAFGGLIATAIAAGILDHSPERSMFIGAGVAGAASLILQATSWWWPAQRFAAGAQEGFHPAANRVRQGGATPPTPPPMPQEAFFPPRAGYSGPVGNGGQPAPTEFGTSTRGRHRRPRWMTSRAFFGLAGFAAMAGAIFAFVFVLIAVPRDPHDKTAALIACVGLSSLFLFCLRKTTPYRRETFWRETVRPLLQSASLFGIGATITGIAREWHCFYYEYPCLVEEGKVGLITGLVVSSLMFLVLLALRGRPHAVRPFLQAEIGKGDHTVQFKLGGTVEESVNENRVSKI